ncbi:MAG: exosortase A [Qipengyuania sp.]
MLPDTSIAANTGSPRVSTPWPKSLAALSLAWLVLLVATRAEWLEMLHQWWNIDTYNHITLIPLIVAWLVWLKRRELAKVVPRGTWAGAVLLALALALWLTGRATQINLLAHASAVLALPASLLAVLGVRVAALLLLPLGMMAFLVPFGDEIVPQLQLTTAEVAIALTQWSGVEASIDGVNIDTPAGLFIVAEACSGVKFLIAMIALAGLVCFTAFESWAKRALFLLAAIIVPILANGVRAWGTIFIAQSRGVEFAAGFDHIVYGWIFFAIVIVLLIGGAWRFFERDPEDAGYDADDLDGQPLVAAIDVFTLRTTLACVAIVALTIGAWLMDGAGVLG